MKKVWQTIKSQVRKPRRGASSQTLSANAEIVPSSSHHISNQDISSASLKVLHRLNDSGFSAYLVGGGVRDLLLHQKPKDFDIATDASPEEIRRLFSNSRIIGRRFRLVHIRYGREIVEVATFRGAGGNNVEDEFDVNQNQIEENEISAEKKRKRQSKIPAGILEYDNVYGTMEEDAFRRDFTINALFYRVEDSSVIDFCQGIKDLENKKIRVIGDPEKRYREDPVRMLRAVRFAAKLGFTIEEQSAEPIRKLANLLSHVPPSRMYDEFIKLIVSGFSVRVFELLTHYGLFEFIFPDTHRCLNGASGELVSSFIKVALQETDARIAVGKTINPAFMLAVLLWHPLQERRHFYEREGHNLYVANQLAQNDVLKGQLSRISSPRRTTTTLRDIWMLQNHLAQTRKMRIIRAFQHQHFRAGYDFLLLRGRAGESVQSLADWWTRFQQADEQAQEILMNELQSKSGSKKRGSRRRRSPLKK